MNKTLAAICSVAIVFACLTPITPSAQAQTGTWIGSAGNHNITTTNNWVGGIRNADWGPVYFDNNVVDGTLSIDYYPYFIGSLNLSSSLTQNITINGPNGIYLGSGIDMSAAGANLTINADYSMYAPSPWDVGAGRTLTLNGTIYADGQSFVKNGAGTVVLTTPSSLAFGGVSGTTVNAGTLISSDGSALGTGDLVINSGGIFVANNAWVFHGTNPWVNGTGVTNVTVNAGGTLALDPVNGFMNGIFNLYLNGGSVTGGNAGTVYGNPLFLYSGNEQITAGGATTSTISTALALGGNNNTITVGSGSVLNITAALGDTIFWGAGGFIKAGTGTLTLTGTNTYTSDTTISAGTLQLGDGTSGHDGSLTTSGITDNAALVYDLFGSQTVGYAISGSGSLAKNGAGTLTLTTGALGFTGGITVNGGTLIMPGGDWQLNGIAHYAMTVNAGATLELPANPSEYAVAPTLNGGTITSSGVNVSGWPTITLDANLQITAGGAAVSTIATSVGVTSNTTFSVGSGSTLNMTGPILEAFIATRTGVIKTDAGTLTLSSPGNSYDCDTTISGGTLAFGGAGQLNGGNYGYNIINNAALVYGSSAAQTLSGVISGSGTLTQNAGSLTLSGANTYTGNTTVNGGNLLIVAGGGGCAGSGLITVGGTNSPNTSSVTIWAPSSATVTNNFVLNSMGSATNRGAINQDGGAGLVTLNGSITLAGNSRISAGGATWNSMVINGQISGGGKLYVWERPDASPPTQLTLNNGANNYSGGTVIERGQLNITQPGALGTGAVTVNDGTLALGANNALTAAPAITLSNAILDAATFTNTAGTLSVTGPATINFGVGGTVAFADSSAVSWTNGTLSLTGDFISGKSLRFGSSSSGLTSNQLAQISGAYISCALDANGYLVVFSPPSLVLTQPTTNNLTRYAGLNLTFTASVSGSPVPTLQWQRSGSPITGATNATLVLSNIQPSDSGSYVLTATNNLGGTNTSAVALTVLPVTCSYAAAVIAQQPMAYYRFATNNSGGTNAYDYAGGYDAYDLNAYHNAITGANGGTGYPAPLDAGPQPTAFLGFETTNTAPLLDGTSQGYASTASLFNNRSNFTLMGWFNINPSQYPIDNNALTHPNARASLFGQFHVAELGFYGPVSGTNLYFFNPTVSPNTIFVTSGFAPGQWEYVAVVSDATANTTTVYLNGQVAGTATACQGIANTDVFSIGKNVTASAPTDDGYDIAFFPGSIDEVAAFDHPLSATTILALYQASTNAASVASVAPTNVVAKVLNISGTNNVVITGAGGSSSSGYTVLTTTNLATPLASWSTNATGLPFGPGGSINYTNPISSSKPKLFYRIRVP